VCESIDTMINYMSRKHKDVYETKPWTKDSWDTYPWAPCNKTLVLRTPGYYEKKDCWAAYPSAPRNMTLGMHTSKHYETKDLWAAYPTTPRWEEKWIKSMHSTIIMWHVYIYIYIIIVGMHKMIYEKFMLDVLICL
jgi:hypothetical protein